MSVKLQFHAPLSKKAYTTSWFWTSHQTRCGRQLQQKKRRKTFLQKLRRQECWKRKSEHRWHATLSCTSMVFHCDMTVPISITMSRRPVIMTNRDVTVTMDFLLEFFEFYFYPMDGPVGNWHAILVLVDDTCAFLVCKFFLLLPLRPLLHPLPSAPCPPISHPPPPAPCSPPVRPVRQKKNTKKNKIWQIGRTGRLVCPIHPKTKNKLK